MNEQPNAYRVEVLLRRFGALREFAEIDGAKQAMLLRERVRQDDENDITAEVRELCETPKWFLCLDRSTESSSFLYGDPVGFQTTLLAPF